MKPKQADRTGEPRETSPEPRQPAAPKPPPDFAELDLSIEEIEERVHPSETNVFDK